MDANLILTRGGNVRKTRYDLTYIATNCSGKYVVLLMRGGKTHRLGPYKQRWMAELVLWLWG